MLAFGDTAANQRQLQRSLAPLQEAVALETGNHHIPQRRHHFPIMKPLRIEAPARGRFISVPEKRPWRDPPRRERVRPQTPAAKAEPGKILVRIAPPGKF